MYHVRPTGCGLFIQTSTGRLVSLSASQS